MNKLKTAIRNAEVDGLSDSIIRNFKADEKAQSDAFLKSALEELFLLILRLQFFRTKRFLLLILLMLLVMKP